jgi:hypothetical protein
MFWLDQSNCTDTRQEKPMFNAISVTELEEQHAELLAPRTVLSFLPPYKQEPETFLDPPAQTSNTCTLSNITPATVFSSCLSVASTASA